MSRRLSIVLSPLALALVLATPVFAGSHVIAQKSSKRFEGSVYLSTRLAPGHKYRIEVTAPGHQPFAGSGTETYLGVAHGRLFTDTQNLRWNGVTPRSFTLSQPVPVKLSQWLLAVGIQLKAGRGLTVRIVDTGHR